MTAPRRPTSADDATPLIAALQALITDVLGAVRDRVHLFVLELSDAAAALVWMLVLGLAATLGAVTAWFALWMGIWMALREAGLGWIGATLAVVVVNAIVSAVAVRGTLPLARRLALPATLRHLTPALTPLAPLSDPAVAASADRAGDG